MTTTEDTNLVTGKEDTSAITQASVNTEDIKVQKAVATVTVEVVEEDTDTINENSVMAAFTDVIKVIERNVIFFCVSINTITPSQITKVFALKGLHPFTLLFNHKFYS